MPRSRVRVEGTLGHGAMLADAPVSVPSVARPSAGRSVDDGEQGRLLSPPGPPPRPAVTPTTARAARPAMMSAMPAPSTGVGVSPSWSQAARTPTTGTASVPIPAAPAGRARSAKSHSAQHTALASRTE